MCLEPQRRAKQDRCLERSRKTRVIEIGLSAKSPLLQPLFGANRHVCPLCDGPWLAPLDGVTLRIHAQRAAWWLDVLTSGDKDLPWS